MRVRARLLECAARILTNRRPMSRTVAAYRLIAGMLAMLAASAAFAQAAKNVDPPAPPLPAEFTDEARRAYAQGLNEARDVARGEALRRSDRAPRGAVEGAPARSAGAIPEGGRRVRRRTHAGCGCHASRAARRLSGAARAAQQPRRALRRAGQLPARAPGARARDRGRTGLRDRPREPRRRLCASCGRRIRARGSARQDEPDRAAETQARARPAGRVRAR